MRWLRGALRALGLVAAAAVLTTVALALSLRSATVRQAVLRWAGDAIESSAGVRASAGDFSLSLVRGELTVEEVVLSVPQEGARPFLTLSRARAEVSWGSLLGKRLEVRSLRLEGPRLELGAPLPALAPGDGEPPAADGPSRGVDVLELELTDGRVLSGPLPAKLAVPADADQLEQLLINLVKNAVEAALETGGGAGVSWRRQDSRLELTVVDEGPGLPSTQNLFVPFFTTKPGGTGIGLVLCRQIAEAHGGSLTLDNRKDRRGCEACLRLPL